MEKVFATSGLRARNGKAAGDDIRAAMNGTEDDRLKLYLATDLINLGDREGLVALSGLLDRGDAAIRRSAIARLRLVSGQNFSYNANAEGDELVKGAAAWRQWATGDGLTAKLNLPVGERPPYRGHTLAVKRESGTYAAVELDASGKEVWRKEFKRNPYGLQKLPNGNVLFSFNDGVREFSPDGKEVGELGSRHGYCIARRLANGNTVVAYYGGNLTEYAPDGSEVAVWRKGLGSYSPIEITGEDSILISDYQNQRVLEVLRNGTIPWELKLNHKIYWASRGADGTTVVVLRDQNRVEAYSRDKKLLWTLPSLSYPRYVQSLPNGNTVVLHQRGIVEVDSRGKAVDRIGTPYLLIHRF
jgi:hypothetical protein